MGDGLGLKEGKSWLIYGLVWFMTGSCETTFTKVQMHHVFPRTDSLDCRLDSVETLAPVVGRLECPSKCCLLDLDAVPEVFSSPEIMGHQEIIKF